MTLSEALKQYQTNEDAAKKFNAAKDYLTDAAKGDPNHEVKSGGKTIRVVPEDYAGYEVPADVKAPYKKMKVRWTLEIT